MVGEEEMGESSLIAGETLFEGVGLAE